MDLGVTRWATPEPAQRMAPYKHRAVALGKLQLTHTFLPPPSVGSQHPIFLLTILLLVHPYLLQRDNLICLGVPGPICNGNASVTTSISMPLVGPLVLHRNL